MGEKSVYDQIKKQNGEAFAQKIRAFDSTLFDIPDLVHILKYAGAYPEEIFDYLLSLKPKPKNKIQNNYKNPLKLLEKAGYNAYVADTLQKQNDIRKYFAKDEELCTFHDAKRFQKYYIINAVKKNVNQIKRENFPHPDRQDEYGTSVISIQILKTGGLISIKNRYNHAVQNPDNTFNSNPDNIIEGLSGALKHYFKTDFTHPENAFDLPDNYIILNNQIIAYNDEISNVYYGNDYYVKDGVIYELNRDYQLMAENFIIDLKNKTISTPSRMHDSFPEVLNAEIQGKKLILTRDKENNRYLFADNVQLMKINANHEITELCLPETKAIPDFFLKFNYYLEKFSAPKAETIGNNFLYDNRRCASLKIPHIRLIGSDFLRNNTALKTFSAPHLEKTGDWFLYLNEKIKRLYTPKLIQKGDWFLFHHPQNNPNKIFSLRHKERE